MIKKITFYRKSWLSILVLLTGSAFGQSTVTLTDTRAGKTWTVPCGVTSIKVEVWGAGGGGGRATNSGQTTGGGGGGAYAKKTMAVSAGNVISYKVGQGGSGGDNNKDGQYSWFRASTELFAEGGKGVSNNTLVGSAGGSVSNSIGDVKYSGGSGGKGTGDGAEHASGGGGGAGYATASGSNGLNGTRGDWTGGTGGGGGSSGSYGGGGGVGAGSHGEGNSGITFGGGGGGAKQGAGLLFTPKDGGNGASGGIVITYNITPIQPASEISSNPGISIGCNENKVTLKAEGGYTGSGVSTLWYEGTTCPKFAYIQEFIGSSYPSSIQTTIGNMVSGNRTFTSTGSDPSLNMENVLSAEFDPKIYKYIVIRYRVKKGGGGTQIYFKKRTKALHEDRMVFGTLKNDGNWHIMNIDMSTNQQWNNEDGGISGWRFDYATVNQTEIEIDYLVLGNVPILENTTEDDDDTSITLSPTALYTTYGTVRISDQQSNCSGGIPVTTCIQTTITRIDKTYNALSGNWNTAANWSPGSVLPTLDNCVNIPAGKNVVVDIADAKAGSLNVHNGGMIRIPADKVLSVKNVITNDDLTGNNFIVESDGNLIQISDAPNTGKITVQRKVSDMNNIPTKMDYVYWSSPVANQNIRAFAPGTPASGFQHYNEATDYFQTTYDDVFQPGKGYAIRAETGSGIVNGYEKIYNFVGIPNNGNYPIPIKRSPDTGGYAHGFNLIGNPYPSNISFDILYEANSSVIYKKVWFWKNITFTAYQQGTGYSGNNYVIYNGTGGTDIPVTGIIKSGQGFIVQSKGAQNSNVNLNFRNSHNGTSLRVANGGTFYQRNTEDKNRFWLKLVSPDAIVNTQLIGYIDGATDGFEEDYDAEIMGMSSDLFYSFLDDKRLLIHGKSAQLRTDDKIRLGANFFRKGNYTIELEQPEGIFAGGQNIYLKDKSNGTVTNLSEGNYTFMTNAGDSTGRFEIIYKPEIVLATDAITPENLIVFRDGNDFIIRSPTKNITFVEVYDITGRLIKGLKVNQKEVLIEGSALNRGIYILKIDRSGVISSKKIVL